MPRILPFGVVFNEIVSFALTRCVVAFVVYDSSVGLAHAMLFTHQSDRYGRPIFHSVRVESDICIFPSSVKQAVPRALRYKTRNIPTYNVACALHVRTHQFGVRTHIFHTRGPVLARLRMRKDRMCRFPDVLGLQSNC